MVKPRVHLMACDVTVSDTRRPSMTLYIELWCELGFHFRRDLHNRPQEPALVTPPPPPVPVQCAVQLRQLQGLSILASSDEISLAPSVCW